MSCRHMEGFDHPIFILLPNEVTINLNMLGSLMKYKICSNVECYLAITIERSWSFVYMAKVPSKAISQTISIVTLAMALYSDSIEDLETTCCFLYFHELKD